MSEEHSTDTFERELHYALQHLYDPKELRKSSLLALLNVQAQHSPLTALRRMLSDAIESLKPARNVPLDAYAWRIYNILTYRYVERLSQREVADDLALSVRQLRRDEHAAIRVLADQLRHQYTGDSGVGESPNVYTAVAEMPPGHQRELDWLTKTFPSETVDVVTIVEMALRTISPLLVASSILVTTDIPPGLPPIVGQLAMIRQALLNVLTLAIHAVPSGRIHIAVTTAQKDIRFCIQAENGETGAAHLREEMAGESIAVSRQLVELSGGTLQLAASRLAYMCEVTISLPAAVTGQIPVLAIDDNTDTLMLIQRYLSGSLYRFVGVSNPEEALQCAAEIHPQFILLDVMLPETDGWELLGRLREHPETYATPVIICTILPQEKLALALGATAFLQKPVNWDTLLTLLARLRVE